MPETSNVLSDLQYADKGSRFSSRNRVIRLAWRVVWLFLFRPTPAFMFGWRNMLLRLFGASIGRHVNIRPSVRIWAPWNLVMGDYSSFGDDVDCYSVAKVEIGRHCSISQYSFLCTASHDYTRPGLPGFDAPIRIGDYVWLCADVYVGPGVTIGEGCVVGARSSVFSQLGPWVVAVGNPARPKGPRIMKQS